MCQPTPSVGDNQGQLCLTPGSTAKRKRKLQELEAGEDVQEYGKPVMTKVLRCGRAPVCSEAV